MPNGAGPMPDGGAPSAFDVFMPRRHAQETGETPVAADAGPRRAPYPGNGSYIASPPYPPSGSSPYPASGAGRFLAPGLRRSLGPVQRLSPAAVPRTRAPSPYPDQPAPFPGWTLHNTPGQPAAGPRPARAPGRAGHSDDPGGLAAAGSGLRPALGASPRDRAASRARRICAGPGPAEPEGNDDIKGLPRRVKQASLAPQLRASPPQRRTTVASAGPASGAWVRARPRSARPCRRFSAAGRRAARSGWPARHRLSPARPSRPDPSPGGGADDSTTDEEARGSSDGS